MSIITEATINTALATCIDPYLQQDWVSLKAVSRIVIKGSVVTVDLVLGYPARGIQTQLAENAQTTLLALPGVSSATVNISWKVSAHAAQQGVKSLQSVKNIIAVASGKGGVGKSTTAVNLALALAAEGATVGILDADIYGPSQPTMLGAAAEKPISSDGKSLEPVMRHGLQSMSIGYLIDQTAPMVWRGPMVTSALQQLLHDTRWKDLDYLIVDLPPGTGDIQLTLAQKIPVSGALIVTTPQDIALLDACRAIEMFRKVRITVLGVVENMAMHVCSQCGHEEAVFGTGGGAKMSQQYAVDMLGALPLDIRIREQADSGCPTVAADAEGALAQRYREIARKLAAQLSLLAKSEVARFPKIIVE